jgi:hypothetical protein
LYFDNQLEGFLRKSKQKAIRISGFQNGGAEGNRCLLTPSIREPPTQDLIKQKTTRMEWF